MTVLPHLAVLAAAVCFATTGSAVALADTDASPLAVGAARIALGGGLLGLLALVTVARRRQESDPACREPRAPAGGRAARPVVPGLVALGAVGVLAYQPAFFAGTSANGVAVGTVVALGTAPVATGLLEGLVRRRWPTGRWVVATTVALAGVVLVGGLVGGVDAGAGGGPGAVGAGGVLASVGAGAAYALYAVAGKLLLDRGWGPVTAMGSMFGVAALAGVPLLLATTGPALLGARGLLLVVWLGVVTTTVAYLLFGWGLARLRATTASTLTLAEPLTATLLGLLVLGERLSAPATAGLLLIALGLVVLTAPARRGVDRALAPA